MKKAMILSSMLAASMIFAGVSSAAAAGKYTATNTDTFWLIAKKYGISVNSLIAANPNVNANNIYKGLTINIPNGNTASWETKVDAIIATGIKQIGVPYVFGGAQPGVAFDCSGFIQYIFGQNGYSLPHSSSMISDMGTFVRADQLRKGDLIFLADTYQPGVSHVGMYIGDNKILHAGTAGTRAVKISTLFGDPYYEAHYWGAKRIVK